VKYRFVVSIVTLLQCVTTNYLHRRNKHEKKQNVQSVHLAALALISSYLSISSCSRAL